MRAAVFHEFGGPLRDRGGARSRAAARRRRARGRRHRHLPLGLARVDGARPDVAPPHVPGHELAGTVVAVGPRRARRLRTASGSRCRSASAAAAARRAGRGRRRSATTTTSRASPAGARSRSYVALPHADSNLVRLPEALGLRRGRRARLPLHDRVRGDHRPRAAGRGRLGRRARLRRRRPLGVMIAVAAGARVAAVDIDPGQAGARARELGAEVAARRARRRPGGRRARGDGRRRARRRSTRSAAPRPAPRRSTRCASAAGTSRSGCCSAAERSVPVPMSRVISHELVAAPACTAWRCATTRRCSTRSPRAGSTRRGSSARRSRSSRRGRSWPRWAASRATARPSSPRSRDRRGRAPRSAAATIRMSNPDKPYFPELGDHEGRRRALLPRRRRRDPRGRRATGRRCSSAGPAAWPGEAIFQRRSRGACRRG